jgi:hypothetical protein
MFSHGQERQLGLENWESLEYDRLTMQDNASRMDQKRRLQQVDADPAMGKDKMDGEGKSEI